MRWLWLLDPESECCWRSAATRSEPTLLSKLWRASEADDIYVAGGVALSLMSRAGGH